MKKIYTLAVCIFIAFTASSQKKSDTLAYYMKNSGDIVASKDSADFIRVIYPPDTSVDKDLITARDFYPDKHLKMIAQSYTRSAFFANGMQGPCVEYYPNGRKKCISNYDNGKLTGDVIQYFPNGKIYCITTYKEKGYLQECHDTTGTATATDGNGTWLVYDDDFKNVRMQGPIFNGMRDGVWMHHEKGKQIGKASYIYGKVSTGNLFEDADDAEKIVYVSVNQSPDYPGGLDKFFAFLASTIHYPAQSREKNIQGRVLVTFIIEKDGSVTNVKPLSAPDVYLGLEAVRAIKSSPKWRPGKMNGIPVRVQYSVPVNFSLSMGPDIYRPNQGRPFGED